MHIIQKSPRLFHVLIQDKGIEECTSSEIKNVLLVNLGHRGLYGKPSKNGLRNYQMKIVGHTRALLNTNSQLMLQNKFMLVI